MYLMLCVREVQSILCMSIGEILYVSIHFAGYASQMEDTTARYLLGDHKRF